MTFNGGTIGVQGNINHSLGSKNAETQRWGGDRHPYGFSIWMAGSGGKRAHIHGITDDFGFSGVEKSVHVHDPRPRTCTPSA